MKLTFFWLAVTVACARGSSVPYADWTHSGSMYVITTPEGADLAAGVSETGFPLLVRLHGDGFDFSQAAPKGEDVRFSSGAGEPLACEIEEWDAARGTAAIWVRVPEIRGNARQEIRMHWGRAGAGRESGGAAVFDASNGYVSVLHMGDVLKDEVGTVRPENAGTLPAPGIVGRGRRFAAGQGIRCGETNTGLPAGSAPHSLEAWFRAEGPNATIAAWGNERAQGKVVMQFASPPHVRTDCYFSNGNIQGGSRLAMSRWTHVLYAYASGDARLYVNGVLDGTNSRPSPPLAIASPARMYVGGWYNTYRFVGDIDAQLISRVASQVAWEKLQIEDP